MSSTKTSSEKLREKTFLKHLQKRRKRKIPLLRGIYHNKMLKILVILVCSVQLLQHLNILHITIEAAISNQTLTTKVATTTPTIPLKGNKINETNVNQLRNKTMRRSINVNSSFNHQNEIVQNKPEHSIQTTKRKLRRKPLVAGGGRIQHNRTHHNMGPTRFKGKRRKYTKPSATSSWQQQQQQQQHQHHRQNNTNLFKPKNYTTIRTTASTSISSSTSSSYPFMTQQQQQFSYTNRSYQRQHQYQQQSVQIPSSTIRVSSTIDHHHVQQPSSFDNSTRYYPSTNIKHYIGVNSTSVHDIPFQQQNVVIQGNTDIVVYRNIGPVPCPPGVRLVPHRVLTATPDPRLHRPR
ncbi:uncharacterized protein LOC119609138, partial [Lucilia sericata]|uniref:uncharacterized protein LOC119609138 n=1 Tax=Lucilia sericata TaxID=13632 RepID=UPI0018A8483A